MISYHLPGLIADYSKLTYFYIFLAGALLTLYVVHRVVNANIGLNFRAVQNDERAAASLGVDVVRVRGEYHVLVFGIIALVVARFAPKGILGVYRRIRERRAAARRPV